ncbi:MAG: transposase [Armatimonadetes bacterium]|nr:transposase [Armatimonadota bacterium]
MALEPRKFKTRKSINVPGHSHYLTFSTYRGHPYLKDDKICRLLVRRINKASKDYQFAVLGYVFMPDHVHLLIHPSAEKYKIAKILQAIKQGPSVSAKNRGLISTDLWQEGGGYDRNVTRFRTRRSILRYIHRNPVKQGMVADPWEYRWSSAS